MLIDIYKQYFPHINEKNEKEVIKIINEKFENNFTTGIITCISKCHNGYLQNYEQISNPFKTITIAILSDDDLNSFDKYKTKYELKKLGISHKYFTLTELETLFKKKKIFLKYAHETLSDALNRVNNCSDSKKILPGKLLIDMNDESMYYDTMDDEGVQHTDEKNNKSGVIINKTKYKRNIFEISVIYFRALYTPNHFNEVIWKLRELLEFSDSIKIPSLPYQLVGSKRIQMLLCNDDILKKYLSLDLNKNKKSDKQIEKHMNMLKKTFALQIDPSLDTNSNIILDAIENENNYLLKPQREGGQNNIFGKNVKEKLMYYYKPEEKKKLCSYVLMEKLFPSPFNSIHCRTNKKNVTTV
uniref:Glutathione synthetase n=1 Tax=Piliocolobus tephrosceles TaxID=591936 RepID=A0A8C9I682_9PRIM